jgi:hypothetical protein
MIKLLTETKVEQVAVSFDGAGDSGSVDQVSLTPEPSVDGLVHTKESVHKAVEDFAYAWLDITGIDWYNNDGGYGDLTIDVTTAKFELTVNSRYTECTTDSFE